MPTPHFEHPLKFIAHGRILETLRYFEIEEWVASVAVPFHTITDVSVILKWYKCWQAMIIPICCSTVLGAVPHTHCGPPFPVITSLLAISSCPPTLCLHPPQPLLLPTSTHTHTHTEGMYCSLPCSRVSTWGCSWTTDWGRCLQDKVISYPDCATMSSCTLHLSHHNTTTTIST